MFIDILVFEDDTEELMEELVAFVKSIASRLYGLRRTSRKTEKIIAALEEDEDV